MMRFDPFLFLRCFKASCEVPQAACRNASKLGVSHCRQRTHHGNLNALQEVPCPSRLDAVQGCEKRALVVCRRLLDLHAAQSKECSGAVCLSAPHAVPRHPAGTHRSPPCTAKPAVLSGLSFKMTPASMFTASYWASKRVGKKSPFLMCSLVSKLRG